MSNYVDNEKLVQELQAYKLRLIDNPDERIPDYVGRCIYDICNRFSRSPSFIGYSYREEMVGDAIENILKYITNFNPEKSNNAFSYFTQIAYYAFLRRIANEKKQSYIKHQLINSALVANGPFESFTNDAHNETDISQDFSSYIQSHSTFDSESFERALNSKKKKRKPVESVIEAFME